MPAFKQDQDSDGPDQVRLDRWLWAARFFKTRQLSAGALKSGKIELNGRRAKPARMVRVGDRISVRKEQEKFDIEVLQLRDRRVGAELAQSMYVESEQSRTRRQELKDQLAAARLSVRYDGRPSKKDRRALGQFKRGGGIP